MTDDIQKGFFNACIAFKGEPNYDKTRDMLECVHNRNIADVKKSSIRDFSLSDSINLRIRLKNGGVVSFFETGERQHTVVR